jgi:WhiB family transcriptional regulator, redox-sensing transcriptional regulator
MIDYATDWRGAGACLAADPDLFFPLGGAGTASAPDTSRALRICDECPVKRECLDFAMQTREAEGIWGGTTAEERVRVLRSRAITRPATTRGRASRRVRNSR